MLTVERQGLAFAFVLVACGSSEPRPARQPEPPAPPRETNETSEAPTGGATSDTSETTADDSRPPMTTLTEDLHLDADPAKGQFPTWVHLAKSDAPPEPKRTGPLCKPGEWVAVDFHKSVTCEEYVPLVAKHREAERTAALRRATMPGDIQYLSSHLFEARPSRCRKAGQPIGKGSVEVTISPEGNITNVTLEPPFAQSRVGDCIIQRYKGLNLGRFTGPPVTFKTTFHVE